ncbi:hypothetical protein ACROSR_07330 [Roseovarius tibetensis]|uniref:hypothetical protein n=1 Tax=Roseovarius tibetensis TaxID=2685897 RepID=UPI003D7F6222
MLSNIKEQLTPELREELAREFEGVLAESHGIAATHLFDQSVQRVVLTLPRNYVHVAKFLAMLEVEELPASLRLWQFARDEGREVAAMERKLGRMMRAYLEEVLMIRIGVEICELKAAL